jgi:2-polyprenyl-3-methyl-5-hydroxy-6-metoxy-1,4-benzoquinol methylase
VKKLTEKQHWDANYVSDGAEGGEKLSAYRRMLAWLKRTLPDSTIEDMEAYGTYRMWAEIVPTYLPSLEGKTMLEVGSAPGEVLIEYHQKTGCIPYGVEYSEPGVEVNRANFEAHGLDPNNVLHSDFFSEDFLKQHQNTFDVVYSGGFIEHFDDPKNVVARHVDLAKPGGMIMIAIPNLRGINRVLCTLLAPWLLPLHNLDIMRLREFRALFDDPRVETLLCRYHGTFSVNVIHDSNREKTLRQRLVRVLMVAQLPLNLVFKKLFGRKGADSGLTSPYLIFIGRKAADTAA